MLQEGSETQVLWMLLEVTAALVFQQPEKLAAPSKDMPWHCSRSLRPC